MSKPSSYNYDPKVTALEHKSFAIGKDKRKGFESVSNVPGPGNYEIKVKANQPQFSISKGQRSPVGDRKSGPGPGDYSPKVKESHIQSTGMGKDQRRTFKILNTVPGPGNYSYEQKKIGGYS